MRRWLKENSGYVPAFLIAGILFWPSVAKATVDFTNTTWSLLASSNPGDNVAGLLALDPFPATGASFNLDLNNTSPSGGYTGTITITGTGTTAAPNSDKVKATIFNLDNLTLTAGSFKLTVDADTELVNMFSQTFNVSSQPFSPITTNKPGLTGNPTFSIVFTFTGAQISSSPTDPIGFLFAGL